MRDKQITEEILRYLEDSFYNYAVLIDGEWGCGKTYYIKNILVNVIKESEEDKKQPRSVKYISLYGCKSVDDIQENIVWEFTGEVTNKVGQEIKKSTTGKVLGTTGKKIVGSLIKHFNLANDVVGLASDIINFKSCIFILDDLERCDCPLNEVFGYINGLVEHEGTKVIIVANEREIGTKVKTQQLELQYILAANDKIQWPKKEERFTTNRNNQPLDIEELERRRSLLFFEEELDDSYGKIREKLIGVTLHYQPDVAEIIDGLVDKSDLPELLKDAITANKRYLIDQMGVYRHHNIRTFLFFLSKALYLYEKLMELDIDQEYLPQIIVEVICDCFIVCIEFKGNIKPPTDRWERIHFDAKKKLISVQKYVKNGDFDSDLFTDEVQRWIAELKCNLLPTDPFYLLRQEYWLHPQKWVEENVEATLRRLEDGKYEYPVICRMLMTFCQLEQIGFPHDYVERLKQGIISRAEYLPGALLIDRELHFVDDDDIRALLKSVVQDINVVLSQHSEETKQKNMEDILKSDDWVLALQQYVETPEFKNSSDSTVFQKATVDLWLEAILKLDPEKLFMFRQLLAAIHPKSLIRDSSRPDMTIMKEIAGKMNLEECSDIVVKFALKLLKRDFEEIVIGYHLEEEEVNANEQ